MLVCWKLTTAEGVPQKMTVHCVDKAVALPLWPVAQAAYSMSAYLPYTPSALIRPSLHHAQHPRWYCRSLGSPGVPAAPSEGSLEHLCGFLGRPDFCREPPALPVQCGHTSAQGPRGGGGWICWTGSRCSTSRNKFCSKLIQ